MTDLPAPSEAVGHIHPWRFPSISRSPKLSGISAVRPLLKRLLIAGFVMSTMSVCWSTASSRATPPQMPDGPEPAPSCSYRLDPPRRTDLSYGVAAVTATVAITGCQGEVQPVTATACIQADALGTQCKNADAWNPAELVFRPWRPGVVYTATGKGCFLVGNPPSQVCTPLGPLSAAL